jgi:hypothetical protein
VKKIIFLNVFLLAHTVFAMDPSMMRENYIDRLCALDSQIPESADDIQAMIFRLTNGDDVDALGDAEALICGLTDEIKILSERIAQEMGDAELARRAQEQENRGRLAPPLRPSPFKPGLDVTPLVVLIPPFLEICQAGKFDFDVHRLDPLVTEVCPMVCEFLNNYAPITRDEKERYEEDLGNLSLIVDDLSMVMQGMSQQQRDDDDLTDGYLSRAVEVLQQGQHATLVPMFVQTYTLINIYNPNFKNYFVSSFLSNVNKFMGGECFAGYRNRFCATLLLFAEDYGLHTGQIERE